ncbi:hypothetical protein MMC34_000726 [Xylographa carneopallida]|nr:hypothetical protein [Xylographa carneopallida]
MSDASFDFIIIGGGTAGCVLASRFLERQPSLSVLLIEAGPDVTHRPHVAKPLEAALLHGTDIDWNYLTTPQLHLDGKPRYNCGVKALSGGVVINSGGWMRGDALDYDEWAHQASDDRWNYQGLLPYFRRSEHHFDPSADSGQHGFNGPMYTTSVSTSGRKYPLRSSILDAWMHLGLDKIDDANSGKPLGVAELVENRRDGLRQLTSTVYALKGVHVMTETLVSKILLEGNGPDRTATGVELEDKRQFRIKTGGEVILSAGAYRTPQLLILSGIGNPETLAQYNIPQQVDLPAVGQNLHDHIILFRYWKLRHPEKGLAMGSPAFADPAYERGNPLDWLATITVPSEGLKAAIEKDEGHLIDDEHVLLKGPRCHLEMNVLYAAFGGEQIGLQIPIDGTSIMTYCMPCLPTSRGTVSLSSADPTKPPIIDPNYYATEADHFVMREGWRTMSRLMLETPQGKELVAEEILPPGHQCLASDAPDELIDARVKMGAISCYHPASTASMSKVVDGSLKVFGVQGLRVVDASVIPVPLAAHYQAPVFALAEQAVDIILGDRK